MNFHFKQILKENKKCFDLKRNCYCHSLYLSNFTVYVYLIFHFCLRTYVLIWYVLFNFTETQDPNSPIGQNMVQQKHYEKKQIDVAPQCMGKKRRYFIVCCHFQRAIVKHEKEETKLRRDERFGRMSQ